MTTWHQKKAGVTAQQCLKKGVWTLVSDAPNRMLASITFGDDSVLANNSFDGHIKNQPNFNHSLFHGKILMRSYWP